MINQPPAAPPAYNVAATAPPPSGAPTRRGMRRYRAIFAACAALILAGAAALAAAAPLLVPAGAAHVPPGWAQVYDATPGATSAVIAWDLSSGCTAYAEGLDAGADATCAYLPSAAQDITGGGFLFEVTVAPAMQVPGDQQPVIAIGNLLWVCMDQQGAYIISAVRCSASGPGYLDGTTIAWHADSSEANVLTVMYDASAGTVIVSANGQEIAVDQASIPPQTTLAVGAQADAETLFTHVTLYSARPAAG